MFFEYGNEIRMVIKKFCHVLQLYRLGLLAYRVLYLIGCVEFLLALQRSNSIKRMPYVAQNILFVVFAST